MGKYNQTILHAMHPNKKQESKADVHIGHTSKATATNGQNAYIILSELVRQSPREQHSQY